MSEPSTFAEPPEASDPTRCPRCGHWIPNNREPGAHPGAMSRHFGARGPERYRGAEICSPCGTEEAFLQFSGADLSQEIWPITVNDGSR